MKGVKVLCITCRVRMKQVEQNKFKAKTIIHTLYICPSCGNCIELIIDKEAKNDAGS